MEILIALCGILGVAGLFVWRFVLLRDSHPNTDLVVEALRVLESARDDGRFHGPS